MFGAGYAAAQDRLFFIDVLRHLGRAELSSFAGGAPGNRAMDEEQWSLAPYTEDDLQHQIDQFDDLYGADGTQLQNDLKDYVAGINAYISEAQTQPHHDARRVRGDQPPARPGRRGRAPTSSRPRRSSARSSARAAARSWRWRSSSSACRTASATPTAARSGRQLAAFDDPDAPTTVKDKTFNYQQPVRHAGQGRRGAARRGLAGGRAARRRRHDATATAGGGEPRRTGDARRRRRA